MHYKVKFFFIIIVHIDASTNVTRPRMHPVQERLWMNQQRMQEVHRRRLYHRSSLHHGLVLVLLYSIYKMYL